MILVHLLSLARWLLVMVVLVQHLLLMHMPTLAFGLVVMSRHMGAILDDLSGLTQASNKGVFFDTANSAATFDLTAAGRALLDDADAAAQRTTLGLAIGSDVQAYDAELAALAGLTSAANKLAYFTGSGTADKLDSGTYARTLLDDANASSAGNHSWSGNWR